MSSASALADGARAPELIQHDLKAVESALKSKVNRNILKLRKGDPVNELMADQLDQMEKDRKAALRKCRDLLKEESESPSAFAEQEEKVQAREDCVSLLGAKRIGS